MTHAAFKRGFTALFLGLLGLLGGTAGPAHAAGQADSRVVIDLDEALRRVDARGLEPLGAALAVASAESTLGLRRRAGLPDLRLGASSTASLTPDGAGLSARAALSANTSLYAGGSLAARREIAGFDLDAAVAEAERVRQDVRYTLADALLDLGEAQARLEVTREIRASEEGLQARVDALVAAGARTTADGLSQAAAVARAVSDEAEAARLQARAELVLLQVLRLDPTEAHEFVPPRAGPSLDAPLDDLVAQALRQVPELAVLEAEVEAARVGVTLARSGGRPALDLGLSAGAGWSAAGTTPEAAATLGLDVPILTRGAVSDARTQAEIALSNAELVLETAREGVVLSVHGAWADREAADSSLTAAEARQRASVAAVAVIEARFNAGAALASELLIARATLAEAELALVSARAQAIRARFALAWVVGA